MMEAVTVLHGMDNASQFDPTGVECCSDYAVTKAIGARLAKTLAHFRTDDASPFKEGQIVGITKRGSLLKWDPDGNGGDGDDVDTGLSLDEYGIHNLTWRELPRVGVSYEQWTNAQAHKQQENDMRRMVAEILAAPDLATLDAISIKEIGRSQLEGDAAPTLDGFREFMLEYTRECCHGSNVDPDVVGIPIKPADQEDDIPQVAAPRQ